MHYMNLNELTIDEGAKKQFFFSLIGRRVDKEEHNE